MAKDAVAAGGGGEERFEDRGDLCALGGEVDEEAVAVLRGGRLGGQEGWKRRRFAVRAIGVERCESGGAGGFGGHEGGEMRQGRLAEAGEGVVRDVQKCGFLQNGRLAFGEGREGGQMRGREREACAKGDAGDFVVGRE